MTTRNKNNSNRIELKIDNKDSKYTSQSEALLQLFLGNNVFLAGPAGSGKSYVIRKYCKTLREIDPEIRIFRTSTTGLSALNIGGETIHSYSGQGISRKPYEELKDDHSRFSALWFKSFQKIRATDVLIIDEISMFSEAALTFLRKRMEAILKDRINQIQIIVAGDFSQLAPVANREQISNYGQELSNYCYGTKAWAKFHFVSCYLDRIYRTKDTRLQFILDEITNGRGNTEKVKDILRTIPQQKQVHVPGTPTLLPTNKEVLETNTHWQEENKNQEYFYKTVYDKDGDSNLAHRMAKEKDIEEELRLRVGDTIMVTQNDSIGENAFGVPRNGGPTLKNGMIGTFLGVSGARVNKVTRPRQLRGEQLLGFMYEAYGKKFLYLIAPNHEIITNSKDIPIAGFTQYPLKLAYAISIHKSQGQTFSKIAIDLHNCWRPGLGYVALSRATNISGITLINNNPYRDPWNTKALQVDYISTQIKRHMLKMARRTRKIYQKVYPCVGYDIRYIVKNRKDMTLKELVLSAHKRMLEKEKESKKDKKD